VMGRRVSSVVMASIADVRASEVIRLVSIAVGLGI
jgi:hypothetical protein